jgi:glycosyltransferase involved in cell wall biosynthesis
MRVLVVDHVGGIETFREKYRLLAADPEVDLKVLIPETWIENDRLVRASRQAEGYEILTGRAGFRGYENRGFFYTGLTNALQGTRPHILHLIEEPFSLIALQSALLCRWWYPRSKIIFYSFDNLHPGFRYPYRPSWAYRWVQQTVHRLADCGTVGCEDARSVLLSRRFSKPVRFVPLGVDTQRFRKKDTALRQQMGLGEFVIGFVGRLLPVKGIQVLLDAVSQLEMDWSCLIVGDGEERAAVETFAEKTGFQDRFRIESGRSHGEIPDLLNVMDVLVLPSVTLPGAKEQFGRVLIEAMACEVPVIGSDSGSIPEVVGDAGIIVPERDSKTLASALDNLHRDKDHRSRLASAGRARVLAHFSWQRVAEDFLTIYQGLLDGTLSSEERPPWSTSSS